MKQDKQKPKKVIMDLERLNSLNADGCPACGKKFTLGEMTVPSLGKWEGYRLVHENDAVFSNKTNTYVDKNVLGEI